MAKKILLVDLLKKPDFVNRIAEYLLTIPENCEFISVPFENFSQTLKQDNEIGLVIIHTDASSQLTVDVLTILLGQNRFIPTVCAIPEVHEKLFQNEYFRLGNVLKTIFYKDFLRLVDVSSFYETLAFTLTGEGDFSDIIDLITDSDIHQMIVFKDDNGLIGRIYSPENSLYYAELCTREGEPVYFGMDALTYMAHAKMRTFHLTVSEYLPSDPNLSGKTTDILNKALSEEPGQSINQNHSRESRDTDKLNRSRKDTRQMQAVKGASEMSLTVSKLLSHMPWVASIGEDGGIKQIWGEEADNADETGPVAVYSLKSLDEMGGMLGLGQCMRVFISGDKTSYVVAVSPQDGTTYISGKSGKLNINKLVGGV